VGTLVASQTVQSPLGDLFQLQDDIARRVVEALALPLGGFDAPTPQRPHDGGAYALFLRANELARSYGNLPRARDLYQQCLDLDPSFAPAWAQIGRCHRVIGKFIDGSGDPAARAEEAFRRALELNPRLTLAHKYYAHHEAETGQPRAALVRLLGEALRHGNDPELFAGLVHACRYCGLFEQAIAAHEEARRLDPNVPSSVEQTILMTGDVERLLAVERPTISPGSDSVIRVIGLGLAGRRDEARRSLAEHRRAAELETFRAYADSLLHWLDRRSAEMLIAVEALTGLKIMDDPEASFQQGWLLCDVGEHAGGLSLLEQAVAKGYTVAPTLAGHPAFDALRADPAFRELVSRAEAGREAALRTFRENGGEKLLGH
jgi:tetratricopeptide (TPR) repeat protein